LARPNQTRPEPASVFSFFGTLMRSVLWQNSGRSGTKKNNKKKFYNSEVLYTALHLEK